MATTGVAVAVAMSRRRVVGSLQDQGAYTPETAGHLNLHRGIDRRMLGRLIRSGVILQAGVDSYYLDQQALQASNERRRRIVSVAAGGAFVAAIAAVLKSVL